MSLAVGEPRMQRPNYQIPWSERAFVTPAEAAQIIARSPGYVRTLVLDGKLTAARIAKGGPFVITVESLIRFVRAATPARIRPPPPSASAGPQLVVSNP